MKKKITVVGAHIAVVCAFSLTQGCLTSESDSANAPRVHGPFRHDHKGKAQELATATPNTFMVNENEGMIDNGSIFTMENETESFEPVDLTPELNPVATTETYLVKKGDTLSQLAIDYDTTTADLVRLNNLDDPDSLYVGQALQVPAGVRSTSRETTTSSAATSAKKAGMYTIQKGDTLSEIAVAAGVSIDALRNINGIEGDVIWAGQEIAIPAGGKVPTSRVRSTPEKKAEPVKEEAVEAPSFDLPGYAADPMTESVPPVEEPVEEAVNTSGSPSIGMFETRVFHPGETLDDIAREYMISKDEIMEINGITDETSISPGKKLRIPIAD